MGAVHRESRPTPFGLFALVVLVLLGGCASRTADTAGATPDPDPWEGLNRKVFVFNDTLDRYALKPVAKGYRKVTPGWLDQTVTRFFGNIDDFTSALNSVFQWRWGEATESLGRFTVNSTLGVAGLFDVASRIELSKQDEDFGLTLARWGVDMGPYVVVPFLGPATVRSAAGRVPDYYLDPLTYLEDQALDNSLTVLSIVDTRADLLDLERTIVGDRYTFIRSTYLQRRRQKAGEAPQRDDFGEGFEPDDSDW